MVLTSEAFPCRECQHDALAADSRKTSGFLCPLEFSLQSTQDVSELSACGGRHGLDVGSSKYQPNEAFSFQGTASNALE